MAAQTAIRDTKGGPAGPTVSSSQSSLRQRKKDATYQTIVDAAWELFEENGYSETSINDIADRANIAARTFFRYFPSKEAVVYPEFDALLADVRAAFFARPSDEPVMSSLLAALDILAHSMAEDSNRNQTRLQMVKKDRNPAVGDWVRRRLTDAVSEMVLQRDAGQPDVELRAKLASGIIGLIMDTSRDHWIETGAAESLPDVGHRCMSVVHELLATKPD